MTIHEVNEKDLSILSNLFAITHLHHFEEDWSYSTAISYLKYYYHLQPDLFLVAYDDDSFPIGAIMCILKPNFDGIHLTQIELFVSEDIKKEDSNHTKKQLLSSLLQLADTKYHPIKMDIMVRHNDVIDWQQIIKMEVDTSFVLMYADFDNLLKQLI